MELITGGELFDEIIKETKFTEEKSRFYFQQLVEGVKFCHNKGVCHRDLKPENLLLDHEMNLKISDFGLSNLYESQNEAGTVSSRALLLHTTCGTPNYVAPEVLQDRGYDGCRADIWSMGVILYVLVAGCLPFDEPTMPVLFEKIKSAHYKFPANFSSELKDLIQSILVTDPSKRASIADIQDHPWYKNKQYVESSLNCDDNNMILKDHDGIRKQTGSSIFHKHSCHKDGSKLNSTNQLCQNKTFYFQSNRPSIMKDIHSVLYDLGCETYFQDTKTCTKMKILKLTPRGMVGLTIQSTPAPDDEGKIIEIRRGKGDILEYHRFLDLMESKFYKFIHE